MKKIILFFIALLLVSNIHAIETCTSLNGIFCTAEEFCIGDKQWAYDDSNILKECCIGTCEKYVAFDCENLTETDIEGAIYCDVATSQEQLTNYKEASLPLFIKLFNPKIPIKPYPKLWDFWFNLVFLIGSLFMILTAVGYVGLLLDPTATPQRIERFQTRAIFIVFGGLILISLPYITSFFFTTLDMALTIVTRIFVHNGDILTLSKSVIQMQGSLLYLFRDLMYFFFFLLLLFRYLIIYLLLVFSPIMIMMYTFYITESIADKWVKVLLINIFIPVIWLLSFALLIPIATEIAKTSSFNWLLLPLFLTSIIFLNIFIYRKLTGIEFSFKTLLKKTIRYWRLIG